MTLQTLQNNGYTLKAWSIATIRNERRITVSLTKSVKKNVYHYVTSCLCSSTPLKETIFLEPILIDNIQNEVIN